MYSQIRQSSFLSDLSKIVERGASSAICYCVGIRGNYLALVSVSQSVSQIGRGIVEQCGYIDSERAFMGFCSQ